MAITDLWGRSLYIRVANISKLLDQIIRIVDLAASLWTLSHVGLELFSSILSLMVELVRSTRFLSSALLINGLEVRSIWASRWKLHTSWIRFQLLLSRLFVVLAFSERKVRWLKRLVVLLRIRWACDRRLLFYRHVSFMTRLHWT